VFETLLAAVARICQASKKSPKLDLKSQLREKASPDENNSQKLGGGSPENKLLGVIDSNTESTLK
jgi:hypothetical protein